MNKFSIIVYASTTKQEIDDFLSQQKIATICQYELDGYNLMLFTDKEFCFDDIVDINYMLQYTYCEWINNQTC